MARPVVLAFGGNALLPDPGNPTADEKKGGGYRASRL